MSEYHKIYNVYKRDDSGKLIEGEFTRPEFAILRDARWEFTEKVDGMNIRVIHDPESGLRFAGKTDNAVLPRDLNMRLDALFTLAAAEGRSVFGNPGKVTLYGEGFGPGIQKGGGNYGLLKDFVLFDVRVGDFWLERENIEDIAEALEIQAVPTIGFGPLDYGIDMVRDGLQSYWGLFEAEGLIARPVCELYDRRGDRIIAKIKACDFKRMEAASAA